MGILNITPDSFYDGSELVIAERSGFRCDRDKLLFKAEKMISDGAKILDIGGESTRPGSKAISVDEELDRTISVLEILSAEFDVLLSIDTSKPAVMSAALAAGAGLVNDVRALACSGAAKVVAEAQPQPAVCLMHMQGQPEFMQQACSYGSVVEEVFNFLKQRIASSVQAGIERSRILVDPGFGFGKTVEHNYELLRRLAEFHRLNVPVLVGVSRKSMIGAVTGRPLERRLSGSIAATSLALQAGAHIIRTHDVADTVDAIRVYEACRGVG
tara:strand:+ start:3245 stop:4057 length:813 start_codon:yes stop_codon:yes gene_type:complete